MSTHKHTSAASAILSQYPLDDLGRLLFTRHGLPTQRPVLRLTLARCDKSLAAAQRVLDAPT